MLVYEEGTAVLTLMSIDQQRTCDAHSYAVRVFKIVCFLPFCFPQLNCPPHEHRFNKHHVSETLHRCTPALFFPQRLLLK